MIRGPRLFFRRFLRDEGGALTAFGLYIFMGSVALSAIAVDVAQLYAARVQLQVAADVAAHAALFSRDTATASDSKQRALSLARAAMPSSRYGDILRTDDIVFGKWDPEKRVFSPDSTARKAVLVATGRLAERSNPASVFLLQFLGISDVNVRSEAVFEAYVPRCLTEGMVAQDIVDMQSNNYVASGFCIHSNKHVALNNNNTFEQGAIVSMPDKRNVDTPSLSDSSNPGLIAALRDDEYAIRAVAQIDRMIAGLTDITSNYMPDYIYSGTVLKITGKKINGASFKEGRIHRIECNGKASIAADTVIRNAVVVTDCEVDFAGSVVIENSIIASTSTSPRSFTGSSGVTVGVDDNCMPGGGGSLITKGGMNFPAKMNLFGAQLLAAGDIKFAAQGKSVDGATVIAGGRIDGSSNNGFGFCHGKGLEHALTASYFRLAG